MPVRSGGNDVNIVEPGGLERGANATDCKPLASADPPIAQATQYRESTPRIQRSRIDRWPE
jgi:hypothetical protein